MKNLGRTYTILMKSLQRH